MTRLFCIALLAPLLGSCLPNSEIADPLYSAAHGESQGSDVVMVVDSGIDPEAPAYRDKVVASYSFICDAAPNRELEQFFQPTAGDHATRKNNALRQLHGIGQREYPSGCRVQPGIRLDRAALADLDTHRQQWNAMMATRSTSGSAFARLQEPLKGLTTKYHGTSTAALIAFENPNVRLLLVDVPTSVASTSRCIPSIDLAQTTTLLRDPDIISAYAAVPDDLNEALDSLAQKYGVSWINVSSNYSAPTVYKQHLADKHCPAPDFDSYYEATLALRARRAAEQTANSRQRGYVVVQGAGNDSWDIPADSAFCLSKNPRILVGAYSYQARRTARYSNYGPCVDLFGPGDAVITQLPDSLHDISCGTSFATALTTRYLTRHFASIRDPQERLRTIRSRLGRGSVLPEGSIPSRLIFDRLRC